MPTKSDVIKDFYTTYYGTKAQTLAHIKDDPDDAEYEITKKDVDEWFATSYLTEGSTKPEISRHNSLVATGPLHVIQVDLFKYSFNQPLDTDDLRLTRSNHRNTGSLALTFSQTKG